MFEPGGWKEKLTNWLLLILLAEGVLFLTILIVITFARMIFER